MFPGKLLLLAALLLTVTTYAQLPTTGLIAWYPFCGNTLDRSGNGLNMTASGPALITDRFGYAASAYCFGGNATPLTNTIYRTPPMPDTGDFTFATWLNADTGGVRIVLANGDLSTNGVGIMTMGHNVAISVGSGIYLPTYLTYHLWHHVVVRRSGSTFSMYLDTVIVGAFTAAYVSPPSSQTFAAGQNYSTGAGAFAGKIDDIAVYDHALNDADIRALYHFVPDVHAVLGPDAVVCAGFSTTISSTPQYPGLNYTWSTGSTDTSITADTFGNYWVSISRPYGCSTSDTMRFSLGSVSVTIGRDTMVCIGDTFTIAATAPAGSSFLWNTGDTTSSISVFTPGIYAVQINNAGCPGSDTMVFGNSPIPIVTLGNDTTLCSWQSLTLSSPHVYVAPAYLWNTGATTASISPTTSGTYSLRVLQDGCAASDTVMVHFKPTPVVALGPDRFACQGDSLVLSGSGPAGTGYLWSTGDTLNTKTVKTTGTYWLTASDSGCVATDTIIYTVRPYPGVHLGPDISVCQGITVSLSSSDTYTSPTYNWSTGVHTASINVTTSGTYTLSVTQAGCTSTDDVTVTIKPNPVVALGSDTWFCSGTSVTLASPQPAGAAYIWSTGENTSSIVISTPGMYGLYVNLNGCTGTDSVYLDEITVPFVNLGQDTTLCQGYSFDLGISGENATYMWSDGSVHDSYHVDQAGSIWASVTNVCGVASDTITIRYKFCDMWIPTAFSPNGDGHNDVIRVRGSLGAYSEYHFAVFNRWGTNVFTTDNPSEGWDGTFNGQPQDIGTYYYTITGKLNGQDISMVGNFELVR